MEGREFRVKGGGGVRMVAPSSSADFGELAGRSRSRAALILLGACVVGVFADRGALLSEPWSALAEVGTPFVLVAFAAGRQATHTALSALFGAAALSVGQAAYYAWLLLVEEVAWGTITHNYGAGAWLGAGALVGAFLGALGSASRSDRRGLVRALGWGLLVAVPLAEGVRVARSDRPQIVASAVLLMVAVALSAWAIRRDGAPWTLGLVSVVAVIPAFLLAENFRHFI